MASTYSTNLKIELQGTGENSGSWGNVTNTNLGTTLEQAVVGLGNPDFIADANLTLTFTNNNATQTARALVLNVTSVFGSLTATRDLVVPTIEKQYIVQNNTTGGQSITVKTTAGTGITVPNGKKMHLYVDGVNVVDAVSHFSSLTLASALPVLSGGTGVTTSTGTVAVVLSTSPTLVTPVLGTPTSVTLTNATGLPISTGVSGLGTGVATFLATPSSANLAAAVTDETGSGSAVFATSPTLVTPALGTPSALVGTNITGTASGLTAGNVTTNANLTGAITSTGNATLLGSFTSANLAGALTDETGSGSAVFATSPTLVTPILGTPTSVTLTNATGLPIATGVSGLGTGVATFLATPSSANLRTAVTDETGTGALVFATSPTLVTPALGTPSSGVVTNLTGTASININGTVGATTPAAGAFTTLTTSGAVTHNAGTANGVAFLNASKVLTTGSALTFTGTGLGIGADAVFGGGTSTFGAMVSNATGTAGFRLQNTASFAAELRVDSGGFTIETRPNNPLIFGVNSTEQMRLTSTGLKSSIAGTNADPVFSNTADTNTGIFFPAADKLGFTAGGGTDQMVLTFTGLGIGTSSPGAKLVVSGSGNIVRFGDGTNTFEIRFQGPNNWSQKLDTATDIFSIQRNSVDFVAVTSAGNVGIGTSSPGELLQVNKSSGTTLVKASVGANSVVGFEIQKTGATTQGWRIVDGQSANGKLEIFDVTDSRTDMTFDGAGNVGIGTTSPANRLHVAGATTTQLQVQMSGQADMRIISDTGYGALSLESAMPLIFRTSATERARISSDGTFRVKGAGTAGSTDAFQVAGAAPADAARITSGGDLLVGATTVGYSAKSQFVKQGTTSANNSVTDSAVLVASANAAAGETIGLRLKTGAGISGTTFPGQLVSFGNNIFEIYTAGASPLVFGTDATERMRISADGTFRVKGAGTAGSTDAFQVAGAAPADAARIDSSGNLLVGTTSSYSSTNSFFKPSGAGQPVLFLVKNSSSASTDQAFCVANGLAGGTVSFQVLANGNAQNTNNSYGSISDVKLKENITDATSKLDKLNQVRIVNFNMIGEGQKQIGVIAQELETVFPAMVEEAIDRDKEGNDLGTTTKSVKYSVFVPMLIKAMQEQQALITALTARITALESN